MEMPYFKYLLISLAALILMACGPDNSPKPKLFEDQRNTLDKAKAVDSTLQQQTQQQQQSVDKQTQ